MMCEIGEKFYNVGIMLKCGEFKFWSVLSIGWILMFEIYIGKYYYNCWKINKVKGKMIKIGKL